MPTKWYQRTGEGWLSPGQGRKLPLVPLALILLLLVAVFTHTLWLPYMARFLIIDQLPTRADAILVLRGGNGSRQDRANMLYQSGYAHTVIASGDRPNLPGIEWTYAELACEQLVKQGVAQEDILLLSEPSNTYEEAVSSLELAQEKGFTSLVLVTDSYHTRRAWLTFRHVYRNSDIALTIVAIYPDDFVAESWWTQERSSMIVLEEYAKLLFYLLKGYLI